MTAEWRGISHAGEIGNRQTALTLERSRGGESTSRQKMMTMFLGEIHREGNDSHIRIALPPEQDLAQENRNNPDMKLALLRGTSDIPADGPISEVLSDTRVFGVKHCVSEPLSPSLQS